MENDPGIWSVIAAILNGNATIEEKELFEKWLLQSKQNREIYEKLRLIGYHEADEKAYLVKDKIFNNIQNRIIEYRRKRSIRMWQVVAAASVVLLITISSFFFFRYGTSGKVANVETSIPKGIRSKITLSDGTVVNLNSGSTISYPAQFSGDNREVILNGEAYFEVKKDAEHPFLVRAGELVIKVLGTHFNVKAYSADGKILTSLLEGSVSIQTTGNTNTNEPIILQPDQQAVFDENTKMLTVQAVQAELYASWKDGMYYFDKENLAEIALKLERGFNVKITIQSERLKREVYSGVFDRNENIQLILNIMKKHRNFDYSMRGSEISIFEI